MYFNFHIDQHFFNDWLKLSHLIEWNSFKNMKTIW